MTRTAIVALPLLLPTLALASSPYATPGAPGATGPVGTTTAAGQPPAPSEPERLERTLDELESQRSFIEFEIKGRGVFSADGKQTGSYDLGRLDATLSWNTTLNDSTRLRLTAATSQTYYDFDGVQGVMPGTDDPWDHLQVYRLGGALFTRVNETWSWIVGADVRLAFESGADLDDSLEIRGVVGAEYRVSDTLSFTFGIAGGSQLEDDAIVFPYLGVDWRIDERSRLVSRELGLLYSYQVADHWTIGAFGNYEFRDWRLDDSRAVNPGGVARERMVIVGLEAKYRPSNRVELGVEGGAVVWSKLISLDSDGRTFGKQEFEPAPFVGLSAVIRF